MSQISYPWYVWKSLNVVAKDGSSHVDYLISNIIVNYGKDCDTLCKPRDDQFGHYTCGQDGHKICLQGWQKDMTNPEGDYCTKGKLLFATNLK